MYGILRRARRENAPRGWAGPAGPGEQLTWGSCRASRQPSRGWATWLRPPRCPAWRTRSPQAGHRARPRRRPGARRVPRPGHQRPRLHDRRHARPDPADRQADRRGALGHRPRLRHDRRADRRRNRSRSPPTGPTATTARPAGPTSCSATSLEDDLLRRDFTVNALALRLPEVTLVDPSGGIDDLLAGRAAHADRARDLLRRRPAADDARRAFHRPARVRPRRRTPPSRWPRWRGASASSPPSGSATSCRKLLRSDEPAGRHRAAGRLGAGRDRAAGDPRAAARDRRAPPPQGRLPAHAHRARSGHRLRTVAQATSTEPDLVVRLAALMHDIGKPATRRLEPGGVVSFYHHDVVGAKLAKKRLRALRFDNDTISRRRPAGRAAPAVLRLHRGRLDRLGRAPLRARCRRPARAAAHPHPRRRDHPQPPQGRPARLRLRRPRAADRRARRAGGDGLRAPRPRRRADHGDPRDEARAARWARPTGTCSSSASTTARSAPRRPPAACRPGGPPGEPDPSCPPADQLPRCSGAGRPHGGNSRVSARPPQARGRPVVHRYSRRRSSGAPAGDAAGHGLRYDVPLTGLDLTRDQFGHDGRARRRERERGDAERLRRGIYVSHSAWASADEDARYLLRIHAAVLTRQTRAGAEPLSAARVWGLPILGPWPTEVHLQGGQRGRPAPQRTRSSGTRTRCRTMDITELGGLLVTTRLRTMVDLARASRSAPQ